MPAAILAGTSGLFRDDKSFVCCRSALHFAAALGNVKITQMLCQAGADVDLDDKDGASRSRYKLLWSAELMLLVDGVLGTSRSNPCCVEHELADTYTVQNTAGYTPLHMSAGYLHVPAVVALLQGGANPEVKDRKGQSVLDLVDSLKGPMAGDPSRRLMLEKVSEILVGAVNYLRLAT